MKLLKVKGIVLRETAVGEADKILTLLTQEYGKLSVSARGARKPKSPFVAGSQLFSYCNFVICEGRNIHMLNQLEIIDTFHTIPKDIIKLSYGVYMLEVLEKISLENTPSEDVLLLIVKVLRVLSKSNRDPKLITRIFEFRMMALSGYMPETVYCVDCGKIMEAPCGFSAHLGGVVCEDCRSKNRYVHTISKGALYTIQYILSSPLTELFNFAVSEEILKELSSIAKTYINSHIENNFKTLDFLEQL